MRSRTRLLGAALAASFLIAGCNAGSSSDDQTSGSDSTDSSADTAAPAGEASVRVGLVAEPASLDFTTTDGAAIPQVLLYNVYETLVKIDQDGQMQPALASEWTVSDDGLTYTFTLQAGVTFSNGESFTAQDVVDSFTMVKEDWTVSLKSQFDIIESVEAPSDTEVVVTLTHPSNTFLYSLTTRVGAIFDSNSVDELATRPIGTGPYTFGQWQRGTSITLQRNGDYWGEQPYFEQVVLAYFTDATALNNAMLTDGIDVVGTVQAPEALGEFEEGDYQIIEGTSNGEVVLSFNNSTAPFNDLRVRQAARSAIDHQALLDTCWDGRGELIGSMVPPTDPWFEDRTGDYPYDVEKAKELLADAGAEGVEVRLRIPTLPYAMSCAPIVESMLEEAGFVVTVDDLEFPATWVEDVFTNADYEMSIVAHVEPRDLGNVFGNPDYYIRYGTPELRTLLEEADAGTEEEQVEKMKAAAKLISEDAASDFLFLLPNLIVADPGITGLPQNAITESFDLANLARE
ncbi:ABC transporter substrate-binding protein [Ornithinimicrobium cryptoxanthini]|uniref:ABC transporter substrate-binding protein n=1 Tax=Ornithinimicrobium cryptoxanthini TaxID=2934161 RepID=A0ABY4YIU8_9MICO|nr:ABC transporter substrate-binding protein [Ornithinimicrobium cryptoxanthini]USQ76534.1 ABC transporter substrate-binding protein [Ornithinimicrobium cryptoxanthini]